MKDLLIVGCGVHSAETAEIVERINRIKPTWNLLGYLAPLDQSVQVGRDLAGYRVLAGWERQQDYPDALLATPFDAASVKDIPAARLATIVDPSAWISASARIGPGCVIYPNCFMGRNAVLGQRVFALSSAVINHDDRIEDGVALCSNVSIAGNVDIEADCYLGQACTIRQFVRVGRGSLVGMGAVVINDVPANSVMVGNPARRLKDRVEAARRP